MSDLGIVSSMLAQVDEITKTYIIDGYRALSAYMRPVILSLFSLTVILFGWAILTGNSELSFREFSKRVLIAGFVIMLALNWGEFFKYVVKLFVDVPNEISIRLVSGVSKSGGVSTISSALDQFFDQGQAVSEQLWKERSWGNWMPAIVSGTIYFLCVILTSIAILSLIISKFCLALFLALAPVMIPAYFFDTTKSMLFDGWFSGLTGFALIPIFTYACLAFILLLLQKIGIQIDPTSPIDLKHASPFIIYLFVSCVLLYEAPKMATSIAGRFSSNASRQAMRGAKKGADMMHDTVKNRANKISNDFSKLGEFAKEVKKHW